VDAARFLFVPADAALITNHTDGIARHTERCERSPDEEDRAVRSENIAQACGSERESDSGHPRSDGRRPCVDRHSTERSGPCDGREDEWRVEVERDDTYQH